MTIQEEVDNIVLTKGFTMLHCGMLYKFGIHGFVFRWSDTSKAWLKSDVAAATLRHPVAQKLIKDREKLNDETN